MNQQRTWCRGLALAPSLVFLAALLLASSATAQAPIGTPHYVATTVSWPKMPIRLKIRCDRHA